jgi:transcriptional regulator with PAS, ATPase and Fis domain
MPSSLDSHSTITQETTPSEPDDLPISSIVRAVCQAASAGPDLLYEVMLKLSLMVEATVPTYGLSIWTLTPGQRPHLKWVEGLQEDEIATGQEVVAETLTAKGKPPAITMGSSAFCFVLAAPSSAQEGAALYGRCVRPLTEEQAKNLRALIDVAHLAHSHVSIAKSQMRPETDDLKTPVASSTLPGMVFISRAMADVARDVERIKDSDSAVLISGESGTGKELVARAIHRLGKRSEEAFVPFNCSAVPSELIESMLFGHRKGTFTGALSDSQGLIRTADNGTLFLDEIGDLPLALQPKLLRFLQEGEIHPLGEPVPRKVNVRVIAATHKNIEELARAKDFREDLYYRIATLAIKIPPLRDRPEDISALISYYLTYYARRNDRAIAGITWDAIHILEEHNWPGNVRELAAEIERLVLYADENGYITPEQISGHILPQRFHEPCLDGRSRENLEDLLQDYERRVITEALKRHDCNVARASEALGLGSRQTLYKKLKRLAIDISDFLQEDTEPGLQLRTPTR